LNASDFEALARYLSRRREALLQSWRRAVLQDPDCTTGESLPRAQLDDHVPAVIARYQRELEDFSRTQWSSESAVPDKGAAAHGLHRWQQGYDLREVVRELGKLNLCVVAELDDYAAAKPLVDGAVMATARRLWAMAYSRDIEESIAQFFQLQQVESAGHIKDLEAALQSVRELEQKRSELWRELAHDLRGNIGVVANVVTGLQHPQRSQSSREHILRVLDRNVTSLRHLLDDVTSLARLNAGQEARTITRIDVAVLLSEFCEATLPIAEQRGLTLRFRGPVPFQVDSDGVKLRRLAQNLVLNAIKYTEKGGVVVCWGDSPYADDKRWLLSVNDSGPGFHAGPGAPVAGAIEAATKSPEDQSTDVVVESAPDGIKLPVDPRPERQGIGEGIGLSIVKRLCELLNATIEMESHLRVGTTVRILLPRSYPLSSDG
jgi:signal transduction histidine kinase